MTKALTHKLLMTWRNLLREHADKGNTVLFSHVLEVAEQLLLIRLQFWKGKLLFYGTIQELKGQQPESTREEIYLSLAGRQKEWIPHAVLIEFLRWWS